MLSEAQTRQREAGGDKEMKRERERESFLTAPLQLRLPPNSLQPNPDKSEGANKFIIGSIGTHPSSKLRKKASGDRERRERRSGGEREKENDGNASSSSAVFLPHPPLSFSGPCALPLAFFSLSLWSSVAVFSSLDVRSFQLDTSLLLSSLPVLELWCSFFSFRPGDCQPLVVFINRKSGAQQGPELLEKFKALLFSLFFLLFALTSGTRIASPLSTAAPWLLSLPLFSPFHYIIPVSLSRSLGNVAFSACHRSSSPSDVFSPRSFSFALFRSCLSDPVAGATRPPPGVRPVAGRA